MMRWMSGMLVMITSSCSGTEEVGFAPLAAQPVQGEVVLQIAEPVEEQAGELHMQVRPPQPQPQPQPQPPLTDMLQIADAYAYVEADALRMVPEGGNKYWIGLGVEEPAEALRAQLGIGANQGLVVNDVLDDSPAKAAGFQKHDVLVSAKLGDDEVTFTAADGLVKLVQTAETKPIVFSLRRQGQVQSLTVAPAERPQPKPLQVEVRAFPPGDLARVQMLLGQLQRELAGPQGNVSLWMTGPLVTLKTRNELPDGWTVTFTKKGKDLGKFTVTKGDQGEQTWGATEKEIDTLPPEAQPIARALIEGLAHRDGMAVNRTFNINNLVEHAPGLPVPVPSPNGMPPGLSTTPVPAALHLSFDGSDKQRIIELSTRPVPAAPHPTPSSLNARLHVFQQGKSARVAEIERQLARERETKGNDHPDVVRLVKELDSLRKTTATGLVKIVETQRTEDQSLLQRLEKKFDEQHQQMQQQQDALRKELQALREALEKK